MIKSTNRKIIISGSTLEVYIFLEIRLLYGFTIPEEQRRASTRIVVVDEESRLRKIESRKRSIQRSKSTLRRLINTNAWKWTKSNSKLCLPVFLTLTFADNIQDFETANPLLLKFIKRLNYHVGYKDKSFLKYVVVPEFQKRGAIHYHIVFFNLKYVRKERLEDLWGEGLIKIKKINDVSNVGAYICKYMGKEFEDKRLDGKKRYFSSRGLKKPIEIKNETEVNNILSQIPKKLITLEKEFDSRNGKVKYIQYQIDKERSFSDFISGLDCSL